MFFFFVFVWKYPSLGKLFQKPKLFVESEIWSLDYFEYV